MRRWLYQALVQIIQHRAYSNLYLKQHLDELASQDKKLATRICYGVLQRWRYLLACCQPFLSKSLPRKVEILLAMGVYEKFYIQSLPDYALYAQYRQLARKLCPSYAKLIEAILHKVEQIETTPAIYCSIPDWLMKLWTKQYGSHQALNFAQATLAELPVYIRNRANELTIHSGAIKLTNQQAILDPGSLAIGLFVQAQSGMSILDSCAAPGAKTFVMADQMKTGQIIALDLHEHRVKLIEQEAKRLGIDFVQAKQADATSFETNVRFDRILCDVPCSGYGVLARKPDLKFHLDGNDMDGLIKLQQAILTHCASLLKPGGHLIYSTCTLNQKENEKQVATFLASHPDFELDQEQTIEPSSNHSGFYMARLVYTNSRRNA